MLIRHWMVCARVFAPDSAGRSRPARIAMIAMTISSSTKVKPLDLAKEIFALQFTSNRYACLVVGNRDATRVGRPVPPAPSGHGDEPCSGHDRSQRVISA